MDDDVEQFRQAMQDFTNSQRPDGEAGPVLITNAILIAATTDFDDEGHKITGYEMFETGSFYESMGLLEFAKWQASRLMDQDYTETGQ